MGKKQHQKDKLYLTSTEWSTLYGGKKENRDKDKAEFRRLPFHSCSLSMQPFEHPYCTADEGVIFDLMHIVPFLKKYGVNPTNGKKLAAKELIKLNFHKNQAGKYHCPVTFKVFNENTHIMAIKTTGNVFSYDAIERLNIKPAFWKDLLTDEAFTRKDLITVQDPSNLEKFNLANFYHLLKNLKVASESDVAAKKDPRFHLKSTNSATTDILNELDKTYKPAEKVKDDRKLADGVNAAHYSTGRVAASFTSTVMGTETRQEAAIIDEETLLYQRVKKKAYIRMHTNLGSLNLELHSDLLPKTCENFLRLCENGYYNETVFHRSIRNFMIQGGDHTGTGTGGQSIWGEPFKDEFKPNLHHAGRGVLSMANSGPNTNKSQFFITYRSCRHLDGKHSVFGRVVGGLEVIDKMEKIKCDKADRPKKDIRIVGCQIFVHPYDEAKEQLDKDRSDSKDKDEQDKKLRAKPATETTVAPKVYRPGIGKYINPATQKRVIIEEEPEDNAKRRKREAKTQLTDFSAW